ncbi:cell surface protein [Nonlabens spongiae]|uniref:Cell surface protein n=1 Tax=Nonlabens spongiae TaxID=331648 RepID=A0A1W6MHP0_9FLAO|nr:cell surface protein [Nonlabens spongiae]ARN77111.1 cell surface protein [Nonlabens spongiae]
MTKFYKLLLSAFAISILIACNGDDDVQAPRGAYENGTIILNEGGSAGGSVSFLTEDRTELAADIFANVNDLPGAGLFLQSIFFDDDRAFIISNGSNVINVVDRFTFELLGTIDSQLSVPRYGVIYDGMAYVTNQADFSTDQDDYLAIIDLNTYTIEETIVIGGTGERMVIANDAIILQNASYGFGNELRKFDPATRTFSAPLSVDAGLNSIQLLNNQVYALDSEGVKVIDPVNFTITRSLSAGSLSPSNLRVANNQLYYTSGSAAYSVSSTSTALSTTPIFDYGSSSLYGTFYGFDVNEDLIYVADAGDFTSEGSIFIYNTNGELIYDGVSGDIAPNSFYFQ